MKYLRDGIKDLPNKNLKSLELDLSDNYLGQNIDEVKYLGETIKELPNRLQNFTFDLSDNILGANP